MPNLTDCTDTLRLVYDRGKDGYGIPVPGVRFQGTMMLKGVLRDIRHDLETMKPHPWWPHIESVLTAGLYVNKKGAHGKGIAIDIDGVVLKKNPLTTELVLRRYGLAKKILVYKADEVRAFTNPKLPNLEIYSLPDRIKTRLACLLSLRFGVVLTAGYRSSDGKYHHEDHIHADLSRPVKWYGSRSQVVCLQETLNAWEGSNLKIDGIYGDQTVAVWQEAMAEYFHPIDPLNHYLLDINRVWLDWLKMIAFNPPKDVRK